jgi:hypothetical protein
MSLVGNFQAVLFHFWDYSADSIVVLKIFNNANLERDIYVPHPICRKMSDICPGR